MASVGLDASCFVQRSTNAGFPSLRIPSWLVAIVLLVFLSGYVGSAQTPTALQQEVRKVLSLPEFRNASFGMEFVDLGNSRVLFRLNEHKLFVPGSTAKLVTAGSALALLGQDFRFHTRVYRTGALSPDGTLTGDLVLVASGDPNLSGRPRADDTLAFTSNDHSYAGRMPGVIVPGDPLLVLKNLARQVAAHGIKRVNGYVRIDDSLFRAERPEPATGQVLSPIVVNDNIIDVTVTPSAAKGGPTSLLVSPLSPYVHIVNRTTTGNPNSVADLYFSSDMENADGSYTATLEGLVPAGWQSSLVAYKVKNPARFAEMTFDIALQTAGIGTNAPTLVKKPVGESANPYAPDKLVAEHISPAFCEEVKVTLKSSQNLHASLMPYIVGAVSNPKNRDAGAEGFARISQFLTRAGINLSEASQADGEGGPGSAFTPDFLAHFLAFLSKQRYADCFLDALPVMGQDGTLSETQKNAPAAGHIWAKTGTYVYWDALNGRFSLLGKGLAGYIETRHKGRLAFAIFVNHVPLPATMDSVEQVGDYLARIAAAAYDDR